MQAGFGVLRLGFRWQYRLLMWFAATKPATWSRIYPVLNSALHESCKSVSRSVVSDPAYCVARQAPLPMDFSRQEYWSGLLFPSPGNLPYPGIEPESPALQADSLPSKSPGKPPLVFFISLSKLVTETNDILFYSLSLVIIGCQWRKKRMRRLKRKRRKMRQRSK